LDFDKVASVAQVALRGVIVEVINLSLSVMALKVAVEYDVFKMETEPSRNYPSNPPP
jgi:hypothetical protein